MDEPCSPHSLRRSRQVLSLFYDPGTRADTKAWRIRGGNQRPTHHPRKRRNWQYRCPYLVHNCPAIVIFLIPAMPLSRNTHMLPLPFIHSVISPNTPVCVFLKYVGISSTRLNSWVVLVARREVFTSLNRSSQGNSLMPTTRRD